MNRYAIIFSSGLLKFITANGIDGAKYQASQLEDANWRTWGTVTEIKLSN